MIRLAGLALVAAGLSAIAPLALVLAAVVCYAFVTRMTLI